MTEPSRQAQHFEPPEHKPTLRLSIALIGFFGAVCLLSTLFAVLQIRRRQARKSTTFEQLGPAFAHFKMCENARNIPKTCETAPLGASPAGPTNTPRKAHEKQARPVPRFDAVGHMALIGGV